MSQLSLHPSLSYEFAICVNKRAFFMLIVSPLLLGELEGYNECPERAIHFHVISNPVLCR